MKILIFSILILTIIMIIGASIISPPQAKNIEAPESQTIKGSKGSTCSTPVFELECEKGLQCLTEEGEKIIEPNKQIGYCLYNNTFSP